MLSRVVLDTNVVIRYRPDHDSTLYLSAVVLQELTAGAHDNAAVQQLGLLRQRYDAAGRLLVPSGEDWWHAGKILNSLYRGLKSRRKGRTPAIPKEEQQRILRDVLIARTAKRAGVAVVTENVADFEKIQRFCDVRVLAPGEYFPS